MTTVLGTGKMKFKIPASVEGRLALMIQKSKRQDGLTDGYHL